jgi:hypothetical protein
LLGLAPARSTRASAGELKFRFIDIRSDHSAQRTDHARHVEGHIAATAGDPQVSHFFFDTGPHHAGIRRVLHHTRENTQPLSSLNAPANSVVSNFRE